MLRGQGCSKCPPTVTADAKWLIKRSSDWLHRANSAITTENVNIDSFGSLCAGWSYSPPCVAIKQFDLEPKSLSSLSASLSFSFCFFSVSVAQSGPPEKHMPIQQRGETKFLFLLLSWPEQTPHKVGKSASSLCQAKILVHPSIASCYIENSSKLSDTLSRTVLAGFCFLHLPINLYMWNPRKSHHNHSTAKMSAADHFCFSVYKVRMMAHFTPKDLTHLLLTHVIFSFSL